MFKISASTTLLFSNLSKFSYQLTLCTSYKRFITFHRMRRLRIPCYHDTENVLQKLQQHATYNALARLISHKYLF